MTEEIAGDTRMSPFKRNVSHRQMLPFGAFFSAFWEVPATDPQLVKHRMIGRSHLYHRRKRGQTGRETDACEP